MKMRPNYCITSFILQISCVWAHIPVPQPIFTSVSTDFQVHENSTVWLPCSVDNLGESVVRWWRGDTLLADSSDHSHQRPPRMRMWLNHTLEIMHVQRENTAEYVCQVVRKEPWGPLQLSHTLTVQFPPMIFPEPATGRADVRLGDNVEIACLAKGVPVPKVTWRSQGKEISNGNENEHVLVIQANSPKISQTYTCTADNNIGDSVSVDFRVQVLYKPIVIADVSWLHAAPGLHAELICGVSAEPQAQIQWFLDEELIEAGPRISTYIKEQQHALQFRNITADDFGLYRCRATNSEGSSEATVELSGRARPAVFKREVSRWNTSALLIWEVDTYSPIIDYTLKFRQVPAPDDQSWISIVVPADGPDSPGPIHSKSYTLSGLQRASTYEAVVLSRNRYGVSVPSAPYLFATEGAESTINGSNEDSTQEESDSHEEDSNWNSVVREENPVFKQASAYNSASLNVSACQIIILGFLMCILRFTKGRI